MPMRAARLGVAMVLALCATAEAALPPYVFEMWGKEATAHLQAEILSMTPGHAQRTKCDTVLGVRRLFRDASGTLRTGSKIRLIIPCSRPLQSFDPHTELMPGPDVWISQEALRPGNFLELFISGGGDEWSLRSGGLAYPIDGPSETPTR